MQSNHGDEQPELYDEFGNYIGPDLDDDDEDDDSSVDDDELSVHDDYDEEEGMGRVNNSNNEDRDRMIIERDGGGEGGASERDVGGSSSSNAMIVLHEDKEHYASAEQVYGDGVKTVLLDEDAMDLSTPIVEPLTRVQHTASDPEAGGAAASSSHSAYVNYSDDYLGVQLSNETGRTRRGVAVVGHLHHGKTTLMDMVLALPAAAATSTGKKGAASLPTRYLDTLQTEQQRQLSLVSAPITALLPDSRGKMYCITTVDETVAALKVVDGAVLVVDVVEGLQMHTTMCIRQVVAEGLPIVLVLSKLDRLVVELKLPPADAYFKLLHALECVNGEVQAASRGRYPPLAPQRGNVAFAAAEHGWLFTLESLATVLAEHNTANSAFGKHLGIADLARRLWGDCYLDPNTRQFCASARNCSTPGVPRTFVQFVLEPIYKIYSACLGEREPVTNKLLRSVGVLLSKDELRASARPLIKTAMSKFLQSAKAGLVDMIVQHVPHPCAAAAGKLARCYSGPLNETEGDSVKIIQAMKDCDPNGPLVIHCVKNYATSDGKAFWTFGRIYSGTVRPAETVTVLGEGYSPQDDEDAAPATVTAVAIPRGRGQTQVSLAKAGNWVLLQGVDANIAKTATIVRSSDNGESLVDMHIFSPLKFSQAGGEAVMKLAIEPLNPSDLPKMVEGLRRISKAYPMAKTKVEESGEHVVMGTGELYMDCLMHDLRNVYSDIEVKVADPVVSFRETVIETSSLKCFAETANKRNKLTFIAEPMDEGLAEQLEEGKVNLNWEKRKLGRFFQSKYNWDLLSSRSVWAFGDSPTHGTNLLMDDTLPSEVDKQLLSSCRSSIVQGFQWATREGPLCEEPVRATKIKILDATFADKPIYRGGGQIIPTARRTVHSALLTATPRLMEPVYRLEMQCPGSIVESIAPILTRRRGHVVQDRPISGTTLFNVKAFLPVLDSFGFETDLRTFTQGQAMVHAVFDHWSIVPGDPLDREIMLHPLEPSPPQHLARELLIKTRRRKGLSEDVSVSKFFDPGMKTYLVQQQQEGGGGPLIEMMQ
jgi:116 kDa U5 small nuclear ribonucleoprotein component